MALPRSGNEFMVVPTNYRPMYPSAPKSQGKGSSDLEQLGALAQGIGALGKGFGGFSSSGGSTEGMGQMAMDSVSLPVNTGVPSQMLSPEMMADAGFVPETYAVEDPSSMPKPPTMEENAAPPWAANISMGGALGAFPMGGAIPSLQDSGIPMGGLISFFGG